MELLALKLLVFLGFDEEFVKLILHLIHEASNVFSLPVYFCFCKFVQSSLSLHAVTDRKLAILYLGVQST